MATHLQGGCVIPIRPAGVAWPGGSLVMTGRHITYAGHQPSAPEPGDVVVDCRGLAVIPGLVNAHSHLAMTLFRGWADDLPLHRWLKELVWPAEARLSGEAVYWGSALALVELLEGGVTTVADMYFFMDQVAAAVLAAGGRALLARGVVGGPGVAAAVAETVALHREFDGADDGRLRVWVGPHAPYTCPPPLIRRLGDLADRLGCGIHIHLQETDQEVSESLATFGVTPTARLAAEGLLARPVLAAHGVHLSAADVAELGRHRVGVAHCPPSNLKLACGLAPVGDLLAAGVPVGLGTDGAGSGGPLDLWLAMRLATLLAKLRAGDPAALPVQNVLEAATLGGAQALGWADRIGTLEAGKEADVVLVHLDRPHQLPAPDPRNRLVYTTRPSDVAAVFVAGRQVVADGVVSCLDRDEVAARARAASAALWPAGSAATTGG